MAPLQGKTFAVSDEPLAEMCDVLFQGIDEDDDPQGRHGFVVMSAGDKGRRAVKVVFPSRPVKSTQTATVEPGRWSRVNGAGRDFDRNAASRSGPARSDSKSRRKRSLP
jgi:hypothetical protein